MVRIFQAVVVLLLTTAIPMVAQLPPEILVDRYLLQAEQRQAQGNHYGALESLQKALDLQKEHGLTLPDEFHFQHAQVAFSAGEVQAALEAVKKYLTLAGRKGEHYRDALRLLDSAEEKLQQIETEHRRIENERRRAELLQQEHNDQVQRQRKTAAETLPRDPLRSGGLAPEMVKISGGRFQYSTNQEVGGRNLQWVEFDKPFTMGKYEVTRGEFEKFVKSARYRTEAERDPKHGCEKANPTYKEKRSRNSLRWNRPGFDQADTHPVTCVSTRDAMAYAQWLSQETGQRYHVPRAAEWQYAARAGSNAGMLFVKPDAEPNPCKHGNVRDASTGRQYAFECADGALNTMEVGQFQPNDVGLHDMVGNVSELVLECVTSPHPKGNGVRFLYVSRDGSTKHPDSCNEFVAALGSAWDTNNFDRWDYREWSHLLAKPQRYTDEFSTYHRKNSRNSVGFRVVKDLEADPAPK